MSHSVSKQRYSTNKADTSQAHGLFLLTGVAGAAMLFGFTTTLAMTKKRSPTMFNKGFLPVASSEMPESGAALGLRALGWGTLFSVSGVGFLTVVFCKVFSIQSISDFKDTIQSIAPTIKRNEVVLKELSWSDALSSKNKKTESTSDDLKSDAINTAHSR
ncbi:transmembrane protein 242-like isoform X2 [Saccoglossus kowalevskii]